MKNSFISLAIAVIVCLNTKTTNAQQVDHYQQQVTNILSELDTSALETWLLADAAFPFRSMRLFNGSEKPSALLTLQEYDLAHEI